MDHRPRAAELLQFGGADGNYAHGVSRVLARSQRFTVEQLVAKAKGASADFASATEIILLLPEIGGEIDGSFAAHSPGRSVAILPAGKYMLEFAGAGAAYILSTDRTDIGADVAINADTYRADDTRVKPVGTPYGSRRQSCEIRTYGVKDIVIPPDNGRLRFLQSETMSINWVEYDDTRGRNALSPHSHTDFEQASLALSGRFVHHLRTPWGKNADLWREDEHLEAGPGSIMIIPPDIIHTSEGIGAGKHILIDIFAPPRADFIRRNWVHNAADYAEPEKVE